MDKVRSRLDQARTHASCVLSGRPLLRCLQSISRQDLNSPRFLIRFFAILCDGLYGNAGRQILRSKNIPRRDTPWPLEVKPVRLDIVAYSSHRVSCITCSCLKGWERHRQSHQCNGTSWQTTHSTHWDGLSKEPAENRAEIIFLSLLAFPCCSAVLSESTSF